MGNQSLGDLHPERIVDIVPEAKQDSFSLDVESRVDLFEHGRVSLDNVHAGSTCGSTWTLVPSGVEAGGIPKRKA